MSAPSVPTIIESGWAALEDGDDDKAITLARSAIRRGGGAPAKYLLGKALIQARRINDAEQEIFRAGKEHPSDSKITSLANRLKHLKKEE